MNSLPRIARIGEVALLCSLNAPEDPAPGLAAQQRLWQLCARLEAERADLALREIVPGMGNVLLRWDVLPGDPCPYSALKKRLLSLWKDTPAEDVAGREVVIPVHYGGAGGQDLEDVARHCALTPQQVISLHTQVSYRVYCLGFQPGFAYLGGLDERLHTPRRATPRLSIPAGSVAIGGAQTGIYPLATPGGWHIIGHTALRLFDPTALPAALLQPGDTVRFVAESL